jgi:hypothetical protein
MVFKKGEPSLRKGIPMSEEQKRKISESTKGKKINSPEARKKMSEALKGRVFTEEWKKKLSDAKKDYVPWNVGKHHSEETRKKLSEMKMGFKPSLETRIKHSCTARGIPIEEFDGFRKYGDYCEKFNFPFKERVRNFFGRRCVECGKLEKDNGKRLHVHHVNYDKKTCCNPSEKLFVCLCNSCHVRTNSNRDHWKRRYIEVIHIQYGGRCYLPKKDCIRHQA